MFHPASSPLQFATAEPPAARNADCRVSGLVLLFVDTLPLNLDLRPDGLGSLSMLLVSSYHWYKGYARRALFVAMVVFNLGGLVCCRPCWAHRTSPGCCAS
jgi:hypothetical protein